MANKKSAKKKPKVKDNVIAVNRKAKHLYALEDFYEAGIVLQGWEVKSLRAGRAGISEAHVIIKKGEVWLLGANITPLNTASTHITPHSQRTRKLLLHRSEIKKLTGAVERAGYTIAPVKLFWKNGVAKLDIALAKGKKTHDKRQDIKEREWNRDKARILKRG